MDNAKIIGLLFSTARPWYCLRLPVGHDEDEKLGTNVMLVIFCVYFYFYFFFCAERESVVEIAPSPMLCSIVRKARHCRPVNRPRCGRSSGQRDAPGLHLFFANDPNEHRVRPSPFH